MKRIDLEEILRKIDQENSGKRQQRRENNLCFIPKEYYTMRKTRKELFLMYLKRQLNKVNTQKEIEKKESDKKCVL